MSIEENKAIVRRYEYEKRNRNNLAIIDELVAEGAIGHNYSGDAERVDLAAMKEWHAQQRAEMPDLSIEIEQMVAEGDLVAYLWTIRGTHSRDMDTPMGTFPATGKVVTRSACTVVRIADGRIVEFWNRGDLLSFVQQLGATITPPQTAS